jgi:hypothetical protein
MIRVGEVEYTLEEAINSRDMLNDQIMREPELYPVRVDTLSFQDYLDELFKSVKCMYKALSHSTSAPDCILTTNGVSTIVGNDNVRITLMNGELAVCIERVVDDIGYTNKGTKFRFTYSSHYFIAAFGVIEKALQCRLINLLNGSDGMHVGIGVFDGSVPLTLKTGIDNYYEVDPLSRAWHPRYWEVSEWFKKQYQAERKMYDDRKAAASQSL